MFGRTLNITDKRPILYFLGLKTISEPSVILLAIITKCSPFSGFVPTDLRFETTRPFGYLRFDSPQPFLMRTFRMF